MQIEDRKALLSWIKIKGYQAFFDGLAEIAEDRIAELALLGEDVCPADKMERRQWARTKTKLVELATWTADVGPGSNCR